MPRPRCPCSELVAEESIACAIRCSSGALVRLCDEHRVFCLTIDGERQCPAFYADRIFSRRQLGIITRILASVPDGGKWLFFTPPKGSLGSVTPLRALLDGRFAEMRANGARLRRTLATAVGHRAWQGATRSSPKICGNSSCCLGWSNRAH